MSGYPLGLRNNNPGNLRPGDNWQGMTGVNQGFIVFKDIAYGIRAMGTDIGNDIRLDGLNTLRKLINEYAPPSENDTDAYIRRMFSYTGFSADQQLPANLVTLKKLIRGHMNVELGELYSSMVTDADIDQGLALMNSTLLKYFNIPQSAATGLGVAVAVLAIYWLSTMKN